MDSLRIQHHLRGICTCDCEIHEKEPDHRYRFGNLLPKSDELAQIEWGDWGDGTLQYHTAAVIAIAFYQKYFRGEMY